MQNIKNYKGYWKFSMDKVSLGDIEKLADELASDSKILSLHIRKTSKDQYGLGFEYVDESQGKEEKFNTFMEDMTDMLKKRFGNGLVGWDVSSDYYRLK